MLYTERLQEGVNRRLQDVVNPTRLRHRKSDVFKTLLIRRLQDDVSHVVNQTSSVRPREDVWFGRKTS